MINQPFKQHSSHWGAFTGQMVDGRLEIRPHEGDPDPSPLLANIPAAIDHPARLRKPLIRRGWLEDGPGPDMRRGADDFIEVEWDEALDRAAAELRRLGATDTLPTQGPLPGAHVFGGSYGWSSAGRFHHAQSQVHRFLNTVFGGYVASVDTYSSGAGSVILSLTLGDAIKLNRDHPYFEELANDTELLISFGGMPLRNMAVSAGGNSHHWGKPILQRAVARGCAFVSVSPLADDFTDLPNVTRIALRPATDTALMLGMAHHLHASGQVNRAYLDRYTTGYPAFEAYLTGNSDGIAKTPEWAAAITGVSASAIADLADRAASSRTLINVTYSLQRAENGEQPVWMALTLAAMLGQGALPGAGFCYGLGSMGNVGKTTVSVPLPTMPQGQNKVGDFIPVARISELLLRPGAPYTYKGATRHYADIRLVYWAGGNPFHHHQDLSRLTNAFSRPDTIILHDNVFTASARHADIILPATTTIERRDIGAGANDPFLCAMEPLTAPYGEARDDFTIFAQLAERLNCGDDFTEGRDVEGWLSHMYDRTLKAMADLGHDAPYFANFWAAKSMMLPQRKKPGAMVNFHADPNAAPLNTPSGKIELFSQLVADTGQLGHAAWIEPEEWLGAELAKTHGFQLIANQPATRLHSQLDFGATSMAAKMDGREVARLNPDDAARLGIKRGDVIRLFNDRGGLLAGALPSPDIAPSVVQISTGAWYAPEILPDAGLTCVNGNPNAVTSDRGTSALSQGCAGQLCLVSIEKWLGVVPAAWPHEAQRRG